MAAAGCVLGGLRAKTQMQRALPMLALFGVRFLCLGTRTVLNSGSQAACMHYAVMEVRPLMLKRRHSSLSGTCWLHAQCGLCCK